MFCQKIWQLNWALATAAKQCVKSRTATGPALRTEYGGAYCTPTPDPDCKSWRSGKCDVSAHIKK